MSRSRKVPALHHEKIDRWIALAGFVTLAVILLIEGLALYELLGSPMHFQPPATMWPETIIRLLSGQAR
jgi:hypothetical protein